MPQLTQQDATQTLPAVAHLNDLLDQFKQSGERYSGHCQETMALKGETRESLINNGDQIHNATANVQQKAGERVDGVRQVTEHGANTASEGAGHINSVEIPQFL
ncbi:hypothetical protein [Mycobacteroides abscessus]|uniref:hypothetical protein n=1 Tax=Mycobacteroides abscessus TaxID=36809 RepID=UPI00092A4411|nr:hypothetical protein [Mycobacteroides abscessus]SHQ50186.1 Uncharacterised protein [Mycobacteroides abscessus subsp. abscessus]SKQ83764.1 Uncharacterised protein [Mycobacteroides abscessus subsp. massiliense]SLC49818.1 Uncharacterised protein [Mycobacteroides abscessus subsp. massiliense]